MNSLSLSFIFRLSTSLMSFVLLSCTCYSGNVTKRRDGIAIVDDTISYTVLGSFNNEKIIISHDVDLHQRKCIIPSGVSLIFNGGIIKNGTIEGNMTPIEYKGKCFNRVRIIGSWVVPIINSSMFEDLSYDNALKDVIALSNPEIKNKIVIDKGKYQVTALKSSDTCLPLCSETEFILNGDINLTPNDYKSYSIIYVKGKNIRIRGNGMIVGDKHTHRDTDGQWGMGVRFHRAINSSVEGITIRDCWGDCVYVGGRSKMIEIKGCTLDHGRRQGISVTKADGVFVRNCKITNVGGSAPEYAIDIEPNKGDTVNNVLIDNVDVNDCKGGILVNGGSKTTRSLIGTVEIKNCKVSVRGKYPIRANKLLYLHIDGCEISGTNIKPAIGLESVEDVIVTNNNIFIKQEMLARLRKRKQENNPYSAIKEVECNKKRLWNNKIDIK